MSRVTLLLTASMVLTFGVGGALEWWWIRVHHQTGVLSSPVLSAAELAKFSTFQHLCLRNEDCEPPLACVLDRRIDNRQCLASECETDLQCQPGFVCRAIRDRGPLVRLCVAEGTKKEGERCLAFPGLRKEGCQTGLLCNDGYCGRPCRLTDPLSCPTGYACRDDINGPSCVPSCVQNDCSQGKQCVRLDKEISVCATVVGDNCDTVPCPSGQECRREPQGWKGSVIMWCAIPCREGTASCPAGSVCFEGECRHPCTFGQPETCGLHEICVVYPFAHFSACRLSE
jgi:hypothetical protein